MENLKMHTPDLAGENFKKLAALFPNAVTETITGYKANGDPIIERAIDADVLRQEISATVVEGPQERYQFTWPDKKKSVVLANQPIAKTLRLDREKSVGKVFVFFTAHQKILFLSFVEHLKTFFFIIRLFDDVF